MSKWISVKDRLPEIKGDYIVTWQWIGNWSGQMYIEVDVCEYRGDRKWDTHREVVAWMPLPKRYEEGKYDGE